jgi:hypothetical protein
VEEVVLVVVVEEHRRRFPLWTGVVAYRVADSSRFYFINCDDDDDDDVFLSLFSVDVEHTML